ncbi:MAG TPA: hypothetical protein VGH64_01755 [Puia sp.]|jgi:hypothetical protein
MTNKTEQIHLELSVNEAITLTTHLTEFLGGSHGRIQRLTNRKYDLLDIVLFAKFGFKSSITLGFQRLKPYFTNNHWRVVKDIIEIDTKVKKMEFSNLSLDKVNKQVRLLLSTEKYSTYEPFQAYDDLKWQQLEKKYIELGAVKTAEELRNIIVDMFEASE